MRARTSYGPTCVPGVRLTRVECTRLRAAAGDVWERSHAQPARPGRNARLVRAHDRESPRPRRPRSGRQMTGGGHLVATWAVRASQAEIHEFAVGSNPHIFGFQIAVDGAGAVGAIACRRNRDGDVDCLPIWDRRAGSSRTDWVSRPHAAAAASGQFRLGTQPHHFAVCFQ